MAIDLKSILGNTKSSILSPAEIADLGQRRQAMQMQREKMEFDRNSDLLNTAYNFAQNATTQEGFNAVESAFNNINTENLAPTQQAQLELIQSQYRDNKSRFDKYNQLTNQLNEIQKFERDQVLNRNDDTLPMLRSRITTFESVKNELASDAYKSFRTPELNQFLVDKQNHFAIIKDALISEDIMTEEEYDLMVKSGNDYNVYNKLRDNKVKSIDERFKALDGSIAELSKLKNKNDAELIDYLKEVSSESLTGELADIDLDSDMVNQQIKQIKRGYVNQINAAEAEKDKLEEIYKTWTGNYKTFGFVPDTGDGGDEESTTLQDLDNDGIYDGTNMPVPQNQRKNLVETKKQDTGVKSNAENVSERYKVSIDAKRVKGKYKDSLSKLKNNIEKQKLKLERGEASLTEVNRFLTEYDSLDARQKQISGMDRLEFSSISGRADLNVDFYDEEDKKLAKEYNRIIDEKKKVLRKMNQAGAKEVFTDKISGKKSSTGVTTYNARTGKFNRNAIPDYVANQKKILEDLVKEYNELEKKALK